MKKRNLYIMPMTEVISVMVKNTMLEGSGNGTSVSDGNQSQVIDKGGDGDSDDDGSRAKGGIWDIDF